MPRIVVTLIALMILPFLMVGPERAAVAQGAAYCASQAESDMLWRINGLRQEHGLSPLALSHPLGVAADTKAGEMAAQDYLSHVSPDGRDLGGLLRDSGDTWNTVFAENLAAGNEDGATTFQQWLDSPSHREIMLGEQYTAIGIGRAHNPDSTYGWYWAVTFGGVVGEPAAVCGEAPANPSSTSEIVATIIAIITRILANL